MSLHNTFTPALLASAIAATMVSAPSALAFSTAVGNAELQINTTLSVGAGWRVSDIDYRGVGASNAIAAGKVDFHSTSSQDNSNLLYGKGDTFSELFKGTVDIDLAGESMGLFLRGRFWYDNVIVDGEGGNRRPAFYSSNEPRQSNGRGFELMDAYIWGDGMVGDMPFNVRLGQQVINWGEGVLFPNGISTINPIDVNALLAPGSEVKEALIPIRALFGSLSLTENLTVEAFYQFEWEQTRLPSCGTFYSTSDVVGYKSCVNGFFAVGEAGASIPTAGGNLPAELFRLPRGSDILPDDGGQYGIAFRNYIESAEMEISAYYINYHSRLPLLGGHLPQLPATGAFIPGVAPGTVDNTTPLATLRALAPNPALLMPYAEYNVEYPEDIQLFGVAWNTSLDLGLPGGATAFSGEVSMRKDQPFQIEDGIQIGGLLGIPSQTCADLPAPYTYDCYIKYKQGDYTQGFITADYFQAEIAFIQFFDQILGASRWTALLNIGASYADTPDKSELLLNAGYNATPATPWAPSPATGLAAPYPDLSNPAVAAAARQVYADQYFPTRAAWGYKLRFTGEYNDIMQGINMVPSISFSHDVAGTTPSPITNFLENRKSIGISTEFIYQNTYSLKMGYTDFYGAKHYNQLADRDSFTISASASF